MESTTARITDVPPGAGGASTGDKGLKSGAIGLISSVVIGVASTAPGYSLAASLGFVVAAGVGLQSPAIFLVAFLPMLCIAFAYYYLNRDDPDCGTTFTWVTKAMGPQIGWISGWAIIVADIIVMANLAQIAGLYTFLFFGVDDPSTAAVTAIGVAWIVVMTWICTVGIELSAKTQWYLLGAEIVTLALFAVIALVRVYAGDFSDSIDPSLSWLNPFNVDSTTALIDGVLVAVFIYWGWDSAVTVNEETEDPREGPGRSAVISTVILLLIYVIVAVAAQAVHGPEFLQHHKDDVLSGLGGDVFPSPLDKLLIIAVLTSAAASTQTTILPTARTSLSMAAIRAIPKTFASVHRRFQTPAVSTIVMGAVSIVWYVGLTLVSEDVLGDSIAALGLMIAFYYGLTGYACVIYFRKELFKTVKGFFAVGVMPLLGGISLTYIFVKSVSDLSEPGKRDVLGLGPPLAIAIAFAIMGLVFLAIQWAVSPEFFRRKPSTAPPGSLTSPAPEPEGERLMDLIVGYDGTECARAALDAACSLAAVTGDDVILAYGYEPYHGAGDVAPLRDALRELGEQLTGEGVELAREAGVDVKVELVAARPADALARLGDERDARMLVVGCYGESPLKGALLGSTPHKLLAMTDRPVLVVRGGDRQSA